MRYLVSLPENSRDSFHKLSRKPEEQWYCTSDPAGKKVGSGGGTSWLLTEAWKKGKTDTNFPEWLSEEKRILIHGGGQSRRLPAYASMGKLLLPIPVFRWERGQRLNQNLLDLQLPLLEKLLDAAPPASHTLLASGDALILSEANFSRLPDSDIISFGLSVDPSLASRHGVFICPRNKPETLDYMLQKPSTATLRDLAVDHLFYIDLGIWILSDRAVQVLMKKCGWDDSRSDYQDGIPSSYDFYGAFGLALGEHPAEADPDIAALSTSIFNLPKGEFFHFGTSREIISSSLALQNKVSEQKAIWTRNVKPHPAMFVQNAQVDSPLSEGQANLWIENSHIASGWNFEGNQVFSGIPRNQWPLTIPEGICLDMAPVSSEEVVIRPYGMEDPFRGALGGDRTRWLNAPFTGWLDERNLTMEESSLSEEMDIQEAPLFPVVVLNEAAGALIQWMVTGEGEGRTLWLNSKRLSADQISERTDLEALERQRESFRGQNWIRLGENYQRSVFFQVDLDHAAREFASFDLSLPAPLGEGVDSLFRTHDRMFRSRVSRYRGEAANGNREEAFKILQRSILEPITRNKVLPQKKSTRTRSSGPGAPSGSI